MIQVQEKSIQEWFNELIKLANMSALESIKKISPRILYEKEVNGKAVCTLDKIVLYLEYIPANDIDDEHVQVWVEEDEKILDTHRYTVDERLGWCDFYNRRDHTEVPGIEYVNTTFRESQDLIDEFFLRIFYNKIKTSIFNP